MPDTIAVLDGAGNSQTVKTNDALHTQLVAILAKLVAAPATEAKQDTLIAKDFATQTTLAAILAKIIAAPATEAKQDTAIAALGTLNTNIDTLRGLVDGLEALVAATNTALGTIDGRVDGLEGLITTLNGYVDGVETLIGSTNTALTTLGGYMDGVESALALIGTRTYGTTTRVAVGSASAQSGAITATEVMVHASTRCFIKAGSNPTAVATGDSIPIEAGEKFHMRITSGHLIAVIRDTADGFLHITPVA